MICDMNDALSSGQPSYNQQQTLLIITRRTLVTAHTSAYGKVTANVIKYLSSSSFGFCLISLFSGDCSRLGRVPINFPNKNFWELMVRDFLQAGYPSCYPTNSVKALKE